MLHLIKVNLRPIPASKSFPFSLPLLQALKEINFDSPVTLFVGENGSGKSTILEALACAAESIVVGSESTRCDKSLAHARELAKLFKLSWTKRTRRGFFCAPRISLATPSVSTRCALKWNPTCKTSRWNTRIAATLPANMPG